MEHMLALLIERPVAACAGVFGMLCLAAYPLARDRSLLLRKDAYSGESSSFDGWPRVLVQTAAETFAVLGAGHFYAFTAPPRFHAAKTHVRHEA